MTIVTGARDLSKREVRLGENPSPNSQPLASLSSHVMQMKDKRAGQLSLAAAMSVTRSGRVIAIEAHPRTCKYLQGNFRLNDLTIEIHNTAIGSTHGELFFTDFRGAQGGLRRSDTLRSSELTRWAHGLNHSRGRTLGLATEPRG
jgi:hypothetical protein